MTNGLLIEHLSNIDTKAVLPSNQVIKLLEETLNIYNLNNVIIELSEEELIARSIKDNKIVFNNNQIIALAYLESQKINIDQSSKIKYINLRIFQILLHEIEHIMENKSKKDLIMLCENQEYLLKKQRLYYQREYLSNPLERIAEINSNQIILDVLKNTNDTKIDNIFNYNKLFCELQGYYIDSYEYPLNYFFNKKIPTYNKIYDNIIIGDKIDHEEYDNILNRFKLVRR